MAISSRQTTTFPNQKTSNEMTLLDYAVPIRLAHRRALERYDSGR